MKAIQGKAMRLGDNVDTDQILPGYAMAEPFDQLGQFAMAGAPELDFKNKVGERRILVAGRNFGCGSSREQAPHALKQAGVELIIAAGFARIFRRNCINIGLPVFVADLTDAVQDGDAVVLNPDTGEVTVNGRVLAFDPMSETVRRTLEAGGLIPRVRADLGITLKD